MYQISSIRNNYNYEENCVVTEICALNTSNQDDNGEPTPDREVAIYKKFCQDKSVATQREVREKGETNFFKTKPMRKWKNLFLLSLLLPFALLLICRLMILFLKLANPLNVVLFGSLVLLLSIMLPIW